MQKVQLQSFVYSGGSRPGQRRYLKSCSFKKGKYVGYDIEEDGMRSFDSKKVKDVAVVDAEEYTQKEFYGLRVVPSVKAAANRYWEQSGHTVIEVASNGDVLVFKKPVVKVKNILSINSIPNGIQLNCGSVVVNLTKSWYGTMVKTNDCLAQDATSDNLEKALRKLLAELE